MHLFDGCVFLHPNGIASISRYARELVDLGFSGFVGVGAGSSARTAHGEVYRARYLSGIQARLLPRETGQAQQADELVYISAGDSGYNRTVLSTPGVHVLVDVQNTQKEGFDRFCAQIAAEREVAVDISVRPLVELRGVNRQKVIRRYEEVITLQNRYEFPLVFSSHASDITHLKSPREMVHLLRMIRDDEDLLSSGFMTIPQLKTRTRAVREV